MECIAGHCLAHLSARLDAVEEHRSPFLGLGRQVIAGALGEACVVLAPRCRDIREDSLAALLSVGEVGEDGCVPVATVGDALLVEAAEGRES